MQIHNKINTTDKEKKTLKIGDSVIFTYNTITFHQAVERDIDYLRDYGAKVTRYSGIAVHPGYVYVARLPLCYKAVVEYIPATYAVRYLIELPHDGFFRLGTTLNPNIGYEYATIWTPQPWVTIEDIRMHPLVE